MAELPDKSARPFDERGVETEPFNAVQKLARRHAITIARSSGVFAALKSAV
jgi:hypothetical protein